ncbi:MAG: cytochrome c oxidase accessory protein CcoG [Bdellovibrionales bacterium]|nr:cytochrome c oxidase accessory protein CcoG [Bdellovibrionales bacterium]
MDEHLKEKRLPQNLPEDSLASLNQFGDRIFIYPAKVKGLWHNRRKYLHFVLMVIFLVLPWIKIGGHQAVLLNLPERKFALFGLTFWAHDAPLTFFVLATLTIGLALITAVWGRVWCGWACPQTVFIETVFRKIESFVEGNHIQRRRLNESEPSFKKFVKKTSKWSLYIVASLIIAHSLLAYFVGTDRLLEMIQHSPKQNWVPFLIILFTTGVVLFDFGWFREQFCIIMCPYGRFQSVLMDENSLSVAYDIKRGEPRRGIAEDKSSQGDCIDCRKCVAVCPTGIDIRNGLQMECIACTACIDACDEVMEKIKKPKGLIRYVTESEMTGKVRNILRPRVIIYSFLLVLFIGGLGFQVSHRQSYYASFVRALETPYKLTALPDGSPSILNHFKVTLRNQEFVPMHVEMTFQEDDIKKYQLKLTSPYNPTTLAPGETKKFHIFVNFNESLTGNLGSAKIPILIKSSLGSQEPVIESHHLSVAGPRK